MSVESVLTFATEGILTKLTDLAAQEVRMAWGFKGELRKLSQSLPSLQDFLGDVGEKAKDRGKLVEDWVKKLKDIADEADDVLGEINYEFLRRRVELQNQMGKKVLNFLSPSNPILFRQKMAHKIRKISASLAELKNEAAFIGLVAKKKDPTSQRIREDRETNAFIGKDEIIIGRKDILSDIVTTLTNSNTNEENLSVMAIAGMPGLGKTTLAKSIYNEGAIDEYFDKKLWVCVSNTFDVNSILTAMLELASTNAWTGQQALLTNLQQKLKKKKYLLVLDDVWNEESEKWERLMSCLSKLNSAPGSKIIVTSRSGKVASITETLPRPELELLSTDECWSILKHAACSDDSSDIPHDLEIIGREIAEKCDGLPLMAKVLEGILRSKRTPSEWSKVKDSRIWDLPKAEDRIMSVLKLSFDNLESPSLKQCFAYCSSFMKDAQMERDDLMQLWMAQGFLHPSPEKSNLEMEDIGNEYFDILFQGSLFQNATVDDDGAVTECKMHDVVHDLAERVSETGSMMRDFHKNEDVATPIIERIPEGSSGKLRSLFSNAEKLPRNMLPGFKALRVLKLRGADIEELPSSIGKLKHMRYLDISLTRIRRLPNSIGKLYNLQTLRATYCGLEEFPKDMKNLINLRYVYLDEGSKFPVGVLGRLTSLRTLPPLYVDTEIGSEIKELAALNQLKGKVIICNLEHVRNGHEARIAKLKDKKRVRHFLFEWTENRSTTNSNEEDVLEGLQPHSELERLEIRYFMGTKIPSWMIKLNNLKQLKLKGCPTLQSIPDLHNFTSLYELSIENCGRLESLVSSGSVSVVELDIQMCGDLQLIPALNLFTSLRELNIGYCERLESLVSSGPVSIVKLYIQNCGDLLSILALNLFTSLRILSIGYCEQLECLMSSGPITVEELDILSCGDLQSIPALNLFTSLREMSIGSCKRLESLVSNGPVSIVKLDIRGCSDLQSISALNLFTSLRELNIQYCERLESLVSNGPISIVKLDIWHCCDLQSIPALNLFTFLRELSIGYCEKLENLVSSGAVFVEKLQMHGLQFIPALNFFASLSELTILRCEKLKYLPTGQPCYASLKTLALGGFCEELNSFPDFHILGTAQLRRLRLNGWPKLKSLPEQIQHFTCLKSLEILEFDGVEALEDWLGNLTSLKTLWIYTCKKLMCLPSVTAMQRLTKLQTLGIWACPLLNERCTKDSGPEWPKISHIPRIYIS